MPRTPIELQGDLRERVREYLVKKGWTGQRLGVRIIGMASLIEAIDIKRKMFFEYEGAPYHVLDVEVSRPTARGGQTLVRIKMRNLVTRAVFDKTFKAGEKFEEPDLVDGGRRVSLCRQQRAELHGSGDRSRR